MINSAERGNFVKYFYGSKGPLYLYILGFVCLFTVVLIPVSIILWIIAFIWKRIDRRFPNADDEAYYDKQAIVDMQDVIKRGLDKLNLTEEQVELVEPVSMYGPFFNFFEHVKDGYKKIGLFKMLKIILFSYLPMYIERVGSDGLLRYSALEVTVFYFTETQIHSYACRYDMCSGEIWSEDTREFFYQDVDCVEKGSITKRITHNKKIINKIYEHFTVVVMSGSATSACIDVGKQSINEQIDGMRSLIRSKKEEITL